MELTGYGLRWGQQRAQDHHISNPLVCFFFSFINNYSTNIYSLTMYMATTSTMNDSVGAQDETCLKTQPQGKFLFLLYIYIY